MLPYRLPAICLLLGDRDGASKALVREVSALGARMDPAAELFRGYAERFRERLDA
jgi:hypothetical protein